MEPTETVHEPYDLNWMISVDDHVIEPPNVWTDRIPKRFREKAPRVEVDEGGQFWVYDGRRLPVEGLAAVAGRDTTEYSSGLNRYPDMRPGCYDPTERLKDMDIDGVIASLCFPSMPRFCGQTFLEAPDKELAQLCVLAYNDWMIDEWCGAAPERYIPLTLIPLWDPHAAAREIARCADKGARAFCFSENPAALGLPSLYDMNRYWDPVFDLANDTGMVVCTHIGSSSRPYKTSPDASLIVAPMLTPLNAVGNLVDWLVSGMLQRHPKLKLALSEGGIGWIPYVLERAAHSIDRLSHWAVRSDSQFKGETGSSEGNEYLVGLDVRQLFRDHVYGCFIDDEFGAKNIDAVGIDNVMVESDYPHTDSAWPHTLKIALEQLQGRSEEDLWKVLQGNARRVFNFVPAIAPSSRSSRPGTTPS